MFQWDVAEGDVRNEVNVDSERAVLLAEDGMPIHEQVWKMCY